MSLKLRFGGALLSAAVLILPGASLFAADRPDNQVRVVEEIVAKVNGKIITRGELDQKKEQLRAELEKQGLVGAALEDAVNKGTSDILRDEINQLLLVAKASDLNINVDADVNKKVAEYQRVSGIADPEKFHDWVRQESGESFEDLKDSLKSGILTQRVIGEEVYRTIVIPKAEMQKYYDAHKTEFVRQETVSVREIQISTGDDSPAKVAAAEKKAKDLVTRLRGGEKFPELARQYSDNADTAKEDGFLGTFKRGELNPAIEKVVFAQAKNYITDPIRTGHAFEILKIEEKTNAGQATFDEVQNEINNRMSEPQVQAKLHTYLVELRQNAFLQIKPGYVDSWAAPGKDTTWRDPATLKPQTTTKAAVANARHFKKFLKVVPYGRTGVKDTEAAVPLETSPVPAAPVKNADGSTPQ
ncbi:MAG TPA: peptidylprolyl isomerase [Bryobacteraceae bacterium]|nr:peptidylprolyl isomerase [Bryobacteraceae bacterium]